MGPKEEEEEEVVVVQNIHCFQYMNNRLNR
jgi:hypothetical protein